MERLGFQLGRYDGANPELLRWIYAAKAGQSESSLFHDSARIEFLVSAAGKMPDVFEIFTLENGETHGRRSGDAARWLDGGGFIPDGLRQSIRNILRRWRSFLKSPASLLRKAWIAIT